MPKSPIAKALSPLVLGVVALLVQWAVTGTLNAGELSTAIAALATSLLVYLVPNTPAP